MLAYDAITIVVTNNKEDWSDDNIDDLVIKTDADGVVVPSNYFPAKEGTTWTWKNGINVIGTGSVSGNELTLQLGGGITYEGISVTEIVLM